MTYVSSAVRIERLEPAAAVKLLYSSIEIRLVPLGFFHSFIEARKKILASEQIQQCEYNENRKESKV